MRAGSTGVIVWIPDDHVLTADDIAGSPDVLVRQADEIVWHGRRDRRPASVGAGLPDDFVCTTRRNRRLGARFRLVPQTISPAAPDDLVGSPGVLAGSLHRLADTQHARIGSPAVLDGPHRVVVGSPGVLAGSPHQQAGTAGAITGTGRDVAGTARRGHGRGTRGRRLALQALRGPRRARVRGRRHQLFA